METFRGRGPATVAVFFVLVILWLMGYFMTKELPSVIIESLNGFECPEGEMQNEYDCTHFDLEKYPKYTFTIDNQYDAYDLVVKMDVYKQTGLSFNTDKEQTIKFDLFQITLDKNRKVDKKELVKDAPSEMKFFCKAGVWKCEPTQVLLDFQRLPAGKHHYVMEIKDSQALYFDIAHIELYMEYINPSYQHTVRNFKFVMLIIALISSTIYYKKATKGRVIRLVSEQGLILLFSGAVILLNDPLFVISYYLEPGILVFLSRLAVAAFFIFIVPFWVTSIENIKRKGLARIMNGRKMVYSFINGLPVFVMICLGIAPDSIWLTIFKITNYLGALWVFLKLAQNYSYFKTAPWREKASILTTTYFSFVYFAMIYKWESPLEIYSWNASKILALTHLFTMYLVIVHYFYYPTTDYELITKAGLDKSQDDHREDSRENL